MHAALIPPVLERRSVHVAIGPLAGVGVPRLGTALVAPRGDIVVVEDLVAVAAGGGFRRGGGGSGGVVMIVPLRDGLATPYGDQRAEFVAVGGGFFGFGAAAAAAAGLARSAEVELRGDFGSEVAEEMGHGQEAAAEDAGGNLRCAREL